MLGLKCKERLASTCARLNLFATKLQYDISITNFSYLAEIDRRGLRWPITDFLLEVVTQVFVVIQALTSKDFETKFLAINNQKSLLCSLSMERLIECGTVVCECSSGVQMTDLAKMCLSCIVNMSE